MVMPGEYPQYGQYPQSGSVPYSDRPPMPDSVRKAVWAMYAGGAFAVISAALDAFVGNKPTSFDATHHASVVFSGIFDLVLWIWMALANQAGRPWARILGTVFFALAILSDIVSLAVLDVLSHRPADATRVQIHNPSNLYVIFAAISLLIGLYATAMIWQQSSSPFYRPQQGVPGPDQQASALPGDGSGPFPPAAPPADQASPDLPPDEQ
jgi:hypothetical protein